MTCTNRLIAALALLGALSYAQRRVPVNLNFRESEPGQPPTGWTTPTKGIPAAVSDQCSKTGNRCAILQSEQTASPSPFGNLMQYVSAEEYRGRGVLYRASVRIESASRARWPSRSSPLTQARKNAQ